MRKCVVYAQSDPGGTQPGTTKYLAIDVECEPPPLPTAATCAIVREGKHLRLICPEGETIAEILFASYGDPTGKCRPVWGATVRNGQGDVASDLRHGDSCAASGVEEVLREKCVGKVRCDVAATNEHFGDPCYGTVDTIY
jgi:hypothetical protein